MSGICFFGVTGIRLAFGEKHLERVWGIGSMGMILARISNAQGERRNHGLDCVGGTGVLSGDRRHSYPAVYFQGC